MAHYKTFMSWPGLGLSIGLYSASDLDPEPFAQVESVIIVLDPDLTFLTRKLVKL
jgi:hypothetical protein